MENKLNLNNFNKDHRLEVGKKTELDNNLDPNKTEEDISSSYLEALDSQVNLENQIIEEFSRTSNPNLRESILEIRKSGEELLKKLSAQIVETFNSNKLVVWLRDNYIEKSASKICKELNATNKLTKAEDYDQFLKTISSEFWGGSTKTNDAIDHANLALKLIADRFPEKAEEILNVWPKLLSKYDKYKTTANSFGNYLSQIVVGTGSNSDEQKARLEKHVESENDFISLTALSCMVRNQKILFLPFQKDFTVETLSRIDSIITKFPNVKTLPKTINDFILNYFLKNPDEILSDSRRADFVFNLWLSNLKLENYYRSSNFKEIFPVLINRIANCSESETKEILDIIHKDWGNCFTSDFYWLLDSLPLQKKDLKPFLKKVKDDSDNSHILFMREDELNDKKISEENFECTIKQASQMHSDDDLIFISNLINKYPDKNKGINSEKVGQILNSLKLREINRFDLDKIHALTEIMNRNQWPDNLKGIVFSLIKISAQQCLQILNKKDAKNYIWIKNEPLLWHNLQLKFHRNAKYNDLRHYFYEVLDGLKQSDEIDDLIKSYATSCDYLDFEEVRSLFFDGRIDIKYLKYFIDKVGVEGILQGIENNSLSTENTKILLESTIKYGRVENADKALEKIFNLEDYQAEDKRLEMIDLMSNNFINKFDKNEPSDDHGHQTAIIIASDIFLKNDSLLHFLSKKESNHLAKKTMKDALNIKDDYSLTMLVLQYPEKIRDFFPNYNENNQPINDREEYLTKLFERLLPNNENKAYKIISGAYFSGLDLDINSEETRFKIEKKLLETRALNDTDFIDYFDELDENQKDKFLQYFEKNYLAISDDITRDISRHLSDKSLENFQKNQPGYRRLYLKLLNDKELTSSSASILFKEEIMFEDNDVRDAFFSNLNNWPEVDGTTILEAAARRKSTDTFTEESEIVKKSYYLTPEEVKTISTAVMNNRGLSPKFWKYYLTSGGENGDFYLDDRLLAIGLEKVGEDCFKEKAADIVFFIKSLEASQFGVKKDDVEKIISNALNYYSASSFSERLENFYAYDPDLVEKVILKSNFIKYDFECLCKSNLQYSSDFKNKIIQYVLEQKNNKFDYFLDYLKVNNDLENVKKIKYDLNIMKDDEYKNKAWLSLLKYDLLNVEESKKLYQKLTIASNENVRTQILNSIDVIGSMLSNRNNINQLEKFFDNPQAEQIENLKEISEFIEKYKKENKGRSIVVMLFAREYLPDRKIEEVIEKVSYNIRKYQNVLDRNSYAKIPEGFRVSIGMEYEITNSTAAGYQELTSQPSLKSDIARLSQTARIGSGRDAVHEIATKPTDNPYLMLLEMKLLHDIEYIDLNFNRSENYQKGARGFHLTIGGERGITVSQESNFLQNAIIAASWGGVQAGETGHNVNSGRGVSVRGRSSSDSNNIKFFNEATNSVELRSLSIDKAETLQRAVTTAFNSAIAIQAFRECFTEGSDKALAMLTDQTEAKKLYEIINSKDEIIAKIAHLWLELISRVDKAIKDHNNSFLDREMYGYVDDNEVWVDVSDFGGEYNKERFQSIIENIDPTLSLEEYVKTTEITRSDFFKSFNIELSDKLIKINNLYLKPGIKGFLKGDQTNALSMLKVTKLNNNSLEQYDDDFLGKTIFDSAGEKRSGYYALQGASQLILTHAVQRALLNFNTEIEKLVN